MVGTVPVPDPVLSSSKVVVAVSGVGAAVLDPVPVPKWCSLSTGWGGALPVPDLDPFPVPNPVLVPDRVAIPISLIKETIVAIPIPLIKETNRCFVFLRGWSSSS